MPVSLRPSRICCALAVAAASVVSAVPPAVAAGDEAAARITARPSENVVAPGETVVLRGRYTRRDVPAADHRVKVQTGSVGQWRTLDGARVHTDSEGRYRVRVILYRKGVRDLRVVGVVPGPRDEAFERVTLMVKR